MYAACACVHTRSGRMVTRPFMRPTRS
jgi:hypothetical protein